MKRGGLGRYYQRMQAMRSWVCLAAAVVGACASPDPGVEVGVAYYTPPGEDNPCPPDGCGGNSPVIDGVYFWQLPVAGQAITDGVEVTGVDRYGVPMELQLADGDRLLGVDPMTGVVIAQDSTLPGTRIKLLVKGNPYEIRIDWAAPMESFWADDEKKIWAYGFFYRPLFGPDQRSMHPLCSEGDGDPNMIKAITFGGDLYDPETKEITIGPETGGWINIACEGSAIYKMHKIGYTSAAQGRLGKVTMLEQRRAMLNAWTSNVCGTGEAFTHQGEPIKLRESLDLLPLGSPYLDPLVETQTESIEAIWDETGAVCLDTHRLEEDDPKIYNKIRTACGGKLPPSCEPLLGDWNAHGHVLTGNPFPAP